MGRLSEQSIEKTVAWWADTGLPASGLCALGVSFQEVVHSV